MCDEGCQDWQDLLQAVVAPECCFFCQSVSRMIFVGYGWYVLPSSTVMLLESAWTTESCSGPKGCAVSLGCCRSSTNGDRRKERYGVMSDCLRSPVSMRGRNLRCGREVNFSYLEVIQETHVGITERDLPLRCRIWDFQKTRTHEQGRTRPLHQKKKKTIPWKAQSNSRRNNGLNAVSFNFATSSTNAVIVALSTCGYNKTNENPSCRV